MEQSTQKWKKELIELSPKSMHMLNRYFKLIDFVSSTEYKGYVEKHHIVPKSMGGADNSSNIVVLSPRLHYIAHYILWKAFRNRKMAFAFHIMIHGNPNSVRYSKLSSKSYDTLIQECKKLNKGSNHPMYGKKRTEESKINQRLSVKGKKWTQERREKLSKSLTEYYKQHKKTVTEETKKKISESTRGKPKKFTSQHIEALHVHSLNKLQSVCPHCNKQGQFSNMKRWHFDKCKLNPTGR